MDKNIILTELKRSIFSKKMLIALSLTTIIVIWYSVSRLPNAIYHNEMFSVDKDALNYLEVSFTNYLGSHNMYVQQNVFYITITLIAVIPYGTSLYTDMESGYARNICLRIDKYSYFFAKYISVFISSGLVAIFPLILSFMISAFFLPSAIPAQSYQYTNIYAFDKWSFLLFDNPFLYTLVYIGLVFVVIAFLSTLSLSISFVSFKSFIPQIFPFFVYLLISVFCDILNYPQYSIINILSTTGEASYVSTFTMLGIIAIISIILYYLTIRKVEVIDFEK